MKFVFNPFTSNFDITASGPSDIIGGTPNTVAGWDSSGVLESIPNWNIDTTWGGMNIDIPVTPSTNPNQTDAINQFLTTITPSVNLTQYSFVGLQNFSQLVGPNDFDVFTGFANSMEYDNTGDLGQLIMNQTQATLGDGASSSSSGGTTMDQLQLTVRTNHTANNGLILFNGAINIDPGSIVTQPPTGYLQAINLNESVTGGGITPAQFNTNINVSQPGGSGVNGIQSNINLDGSIDYLVGYAFGLQVHSSGVVNNSVNAYQDNTQLQSGASVNGHTSYTAFPNMQAGSTLNGYVVLSANPNLDADMTGFGYTGVGISGQVNTDMSYMQPFSIGANLNASANVTGSVIAYNDFTNVQSGATIGGSYQIMALQPNIHTGAVVSQLSGIQIGPSINNTMSGNVSLLQIDPGGSGTVSNLSGVDINLSGLNSTNRKVGLSINDGVINANSTITVQTGGFDSANLIVPQLNVLTPTTGTVIGLNAAALFNIQDNFSTPTIGSNAIAVGFVGQSDVAPGKTIDAISMALAGIQVSDNGTITDLIMYDAVGAIPGTGSPVITNEYMFRGRPLVPGGLATNLWGVSIEDSAAENFMSKSLAIGTSNKKVTAGTRLNISDAISAPSIPEYSTSLMNTSLTMTTSPAITLSGYKSIIVPHLDNAVSTNSNIYNFFGLIDRTSADDLGDFNNVSGVASMLNQDNGNKAIGTYAGIKTGNHTVNTGVIGEMIDIYAKASTLTGGTVTNRKGIIIEADTGFTKQNWISGLSRIGGSSFSAPAYELVVAGNAQVTALSTGVVHSDSTGLLTSSPVVLTSQVSGVLPIANGGTNSSTALNNNRVIISSGGAIVEQTALTANAPMRTNGSGLPTTGNTNLATEVTGVLPEANGGTHQSTYATGDTLYASASNTLSKLPIGSTGQVLTVVAGVPAWQPSGSAGDYDISSSSGTFSTGSTSFVDVTNLTATITTTGRPVALVLVADGDTTSGNEASVQCAVGVGNTVHGAIAFLEGSTLISQQNTTESDTGNVDTAQYIPSSAFSHVYVPAAGTYTYKVQARIATGTSIGVVYTKLAAYEL